MVTSWISIHEDLRLNSSLAKFEIWFSDGLHLKWYWKVGCVICYCWRKCLKLWSIDGKGEDGEAEDKKFKFVGIKKNVNE